MTPARERVDRIADARELLTGEAEATVCEITLALGEIALHVGNGSEAEERLRTSCAVLESKNAPAWCEALGALGEALAIRDPVGAVVYLDQAIAAARTGGWHHIHASSLCRRARALGDRRSLREAEELAERSAEEEGSRLWRDLRRTEAALG